MKFVTDPNQVGKKKWSDYVRNHPNGNVFQTPEMYEVYLRTPNYNPIFISVFNKTGNIEALLLALIQKERLGIIGTMTARSIILGGPLVSNNDIEVFKLLIAKYNTIVKRKAVYSQFRNQWDFENFKNAFSNEGFAFKEHLNILIDLKKSKEALWKDVHTKRRNEIRRATKEGTTFAVKETLHDLKQCYSILKTVYHRAKLPFPKFEFFKNIFLQSNENFGLKQFCAEYDNKIIGCMIVMVFNEVIYDYYAGAYSEYYKKYPNDLVTWEVINWGIENEYSRFDFGGAGKPNVPYGVREYKKKFGGVFVNYGRYEKIHKPLLFLLGKNGLIIWKKIRK